MKEKRGRGESARCEGSGEEERKEINSTKKREGHNLLYCKREGARKKEQKGEKFWPSLFQKKKRISSLERGVT